MAAPTGGKRRLTPEDIYNIVLVSDAQISPDGRQVAFTQTILDRDKNDYRSSIYIVPAEGGTPRRFTAADAKDTFPRWSPDGQRLAFLSNRSGTSQIWTISLAGGEATQLTNLPEPVTYFTWSPDGSTIAFVTKTEPSQLATTEDGEKPAKEQEKSDVVRITRIRFRADGVSGFLDDKHTHIWCISAAGGDPWQITSCDFDDRWPAWSPGGHEIAFVSNRTPDREYNTVSEIWAVPARGGEARPIATGDDADFGQPVWSPDGTGIAFSGHRYPEAGGAVDSHVWVAAGGDIRCLTTGLGRSVGDFGINDTFASANPGLSWTTSCYLYFQVSDAGNTHIYRLPAAGGDPELVVGGQRRVLDFSVSQDGSRIAFVAGDPLNPCDVFVCSGDGSDERRLTAVNEEFFSTVALSRPEEFRVPSQAEDRGEVHGWVMKPIGFEPGRKYPMVLEIHGGPHGMYANHYFHEFQLLAAQGYVVVYTNPRGSQGYGEAHASYTRGAWGEKDMPDLMAAVDYVIAQGYVDPNRLGVTGGSYGGYMTNWVIGHTDRFKAAVTQRCVSDLYSFFGTSDIGFHFGAYEWGGVPWESRETYQRLSPITYVEQIKTPLLILHSEEDYRCPIAQAEQLFISLKKLGREVEFVRFPGENHNLSRSGKPKHRVERLQFILGWFERYL
ncbi:MAG: S9 family peptidase [Sphaerobacter sp.]|nr:S9 family peptidase [Sphaerobacter sp.]